MQPATPQNLVQPQLRQPSVKTRRDFLKFAALGGIGLGGVVIYQVVQSGASDKGLSSQSGGSKTGLSAKNASKAFREDLGNGVTLEMVEIPGGTFLMGSPESEEGRDDDEGPQREVTVPALAMGIIRQILRG